MPAGDKHQCLSPPPVQMRLYGRGQSWLSFEQSSSPPISLDSPVLLTHCFGKETIGIGAGLISVQVFLSIRTSFPRSRCHPARIGPRSGHVFCIWLLNRTRSRHFAFLFIHDDTHKVIPYTHRIIPATRINTFHHCPLCSNLILYQPASASMSPSAATVNARGGNKRPESLRPDCWATSGPYPHVAVHNICSISFPLALVALMCLRFLICSVAPLPTVLSRSIS